MPDASDSSAAEVRRRLDQYGIDTVLIGGLAANHYRLTPRFTADIDLLAASLTGLADVLRAEGAEVTAVAEREQDPYLLLVRRGELSVDILLAETDYQRTAMERAVDGVITAEDVIVHKLLAWRTRDRDDVASILSTGRSLDESYIRRWADAWEVSDRWARALAEFRSSS